MEILAIDPGGTTGLAFVDAKGCIVNLCTVNTHLAVFDMIMQNAADLSVVVIEDFIGAGPRTKEAISTLKLIGGVIAVCNVFGLEVVMQTPQTRIPSLPEAKARTPRGTIIHMVDAYAHALAYLYKRDHVAIKCK